MESQMKREPRIVKPEDKCDFCQIKEAKITDGTYVFCSKECNDLMIEDAHQAMAEKMCGRCYDVVDELFAPNCDEKPEDLLGQPIGMYHCPDCGAMVVAGIPHPHLCQRCIDQQHPGIDIIKLTDEQKEIMEHTAHRTANGRYRGNSDDMHKLVELGYMHPLDSTSFNPDEYFCLTSRGKKVLKHMEND